MPLGRSTDQTTILVVPRRPGPLVDLAPGVAERDDLDDLLDDVFGEPPTDGPGVTDLVLAGCGLVLLLLARRDVVGDWAYVAGGAGIALSLVLPIRALLTVPRRRREAREIAAVLDSGTPLEVGDPITAALADAYSALLVQTDRSGATGEDARDIAHQAVLEVATLLRGRPPQGSAEREFVRTRTEAVRGLTDDLARARDDATSPAADTSGAAVAALDRIDAGNGTVERIAALRRTVNRQLMRSDES